MLNSVNNITLWLRYKFILGVSLIILTNCQKGRDKKSLEYMNFSCTHVDSIWAFVNEFDATNKFAETAINEYNRLNAIPDLQDSAKKILTLLENHAKLNPDPVFLSYYCAMKSHNAIADDDDANVRYWHEKWQSYEPFASSNNIISHGLDMGFYSYRKNLFDSAIINFNKSLDVSESSGDTFYRNIILINLGATFYKVNMYKSASECFSKALVEMEPKNIDNIEPNRLNELIMLNNNLMVSFSQEGKYQEVFDIYHKYENFLGQEEIEEQTKTLFKLNYITALTNTENYTKSEKILLSIIPPNLDDYNYSYFSKVRSHLWLNQGKYDSFSRFYNNFLPILYENQPSSIDAHIMNLKEGLKFGLIALNYDSLYTRYIEIEPNLYNYNSLSYYCNLFSQIESKRGNTVSSLEWKNKELEFSLAFNKNSDNIKLSNIKEEIKRAKILKKVSDQENLIERSKLRQNWLTASSAIFGALLIVLALLFISMNRSRKKRINILALEAELKEKEVELLKIQNEKQANSVITSNMAIQKISELSNFIRQSDLAKNPTMIDIRMNLDRLTEVVYKEYNEEVQEDIFENYEYLREKYPCTKDLNTTSFRVMILSILENTPKDIANLLNLNMQYVRNVRSKIKKDLQNEIGVDWDWPNLK